MATKEDILKKLQSVPYPGYSRDIVSFGLVKDVRACGDMAALKLELVTTDGKVSDKLRQPVEQAVRELGFTEINLQIIEKTAAEAKAEKQMARQAATDSSLAGVKYKIAIASGKGGVGKSTVAVNLAFALKALGKNVGLLDADIYGPNLPMMLGLEGQSPRSANRKIIPLERDGVKVMSLGFLAPSDTAVIWRGPLVGRAIEQMLRDVEWGELDFLIIDLPPGTGDAQLTISQKLVLTGAVIVSTPQPVALSDAMKGLRMFQKVNVPVLGVIENMSRFLCPDCGKEHDIFGYGGAREAAQRERVRFLGDIPIIAAIRVGGDTGAPVVLAQPQLEVARRFLKVAQNVLDVVEAQTEVIPRRFEL
jgi:ATP-binding protein involved in chromosome partitioning